MCQRHPTAPPREGSEVQTVHRWPDPAEKRHGEQSPVRENPLGAARPTKGTRIRNCRSPTLSTLSNLVCSNFERARGS